MGARNHRVSSLGRPQSWVLVLLALLGVWVSSPHHHAMKQGGHTMSSLKSLPSLKCYDMVRESFSIKAIFHSEKVLVNMYMN